jgi:CubicO group peptidase (beta-lactamase class C family)
MLAQSPEPSFAGLDDYIAEVMDEGHVPGLAACVVDKARIIWSNAYGWSDIDNRVPMGLDRIQNIGSISKTFAATAVMQLEELGLLDLDRDISDYLGFAIRNPHHDQTPISTRQLMIHTSSLRDGSAYARHYACGDPRLSLRAWIQAFFSPDGSFYDSAENFHPWRPGERWRYSNLAFGVMGLIVESISGLPFDLYCRRNIFAPLGMRSTSWMITDLDQNRFSKPYSWVENGVVRGASWGDVKLGVVTPDGLTHDRKLADGYHANCYYNHANYPDGFLRTTVRDLSRYLRAFLNDGKFDGVRILESGTVRQMFTPQILPPEEDGKRTYGLTWYALEKIGNQRLWGHGGGDPGIGTGMMCLRESGKGIIVFTNTSMSPAPRAVLEKLAAIAISL